jgi:hypothetical protein
VTAATADNSGIAPCHGPSRIVRHDRWSYVHA